LSRRQANKVAPPPGKIFFRSPTPLKKTGPDREVDPPVGAGRMKPHVVCWQTIFNQNRMGCHMHLTCQTRFRPLLAFLRATASSGEVFCPLRPK
jgi:hypothetical protein